MVSTKEMERLYQYLKTPIKLGPVLKEEEAFTDSPSIFKHEGSWYMLYISISKEVSISGYETHIARSVDLFNWEALGTILKRNDSNSWDSKQIAGYVAFPDILFGNTNELRKVNDKYYFSYIAGNSDGYEPDPLCMGLAYTEKPLDLDSYRRLDNPILRPDDKIKTLYKSYLFEDIDGISGFRYLNAYNAKDFNNKERIYLAVSNDGETWKKYGDKPIIDDVKDNPKVIISGDPQIVKIGDIYVMFYFKLEEGRAYNTFAASYDLVNWTRWAGEPLIKSEKDFEDIYAHKSWVIKEGDRTYHFYCTVNSKNERFIALATN